MSLYTTIGRDRAIEACLFPNPPVPEAAIRAPVDGFEDSYEIENEDEFMFIDDASDSETVES